MRRTQTAFGPVVTLLSPSKEASEKSLSFLQQWTGLAALEGDACRLSGDTLDSLMEPIWWLPSSSRIQWESKAMQCSQTGTILHFLSGNRTSAAASSPSSVASAQSVFHLLAIQNVDTVREARAAIAENFSIGSSPLKTALLSGLFGQPIRMHHLVSSGKFRFFQLHQPSLPIVELPSVPTQNGVHSMTMQILKPGFLKEIVVPTDENVYYGDGTSLLQRFAHSSLSTPVTGLYQFPQGGLAIRPVPIAKHDSQISPPSLVFHVANLDGLSEALLQSNNGGIDLPRGRTVTKIGYNGMPNRGQIMLRDPTHLPGLDIRFCGAKEPTAVFAEAHESLLAGSIASLQSQRVLHQQHQHGADGPDAGTGDPQSDPRIQRTDCWVEFRASLANPRGFWTHWHQQRHMAKSKLSKAPDLPFQ